MDLADRCLDLPDELAPACIDRIVADLASQFDQVVPVDIQQSALAVRYSACSSFFICSGAMETTGETFRPPGLGSLLMVAHRLAESETETR